MDTGMETPKIPSILIESTTENSLNWSQWTRLNWIQMINSELNELTKNNGACLLFFFLLIVIVFHMKSSLQMCDITK
jgi:hypothetical protein